FSYSAMAYFPLPVLAESSSRSFHLARACNNERLVSSEVSKFLRPFLEPPYLISPVSSHIPANRTLISLFKILLQRSSKSIDQGHPHFNCGHLSIILPIFIQTLQLG